MGAINWPAVILNLRGAGMTCREIAEATGYAGHNSVSGIACGYWSPRLEDARALALLDLHLDRCPDRHSLEVIGR